MDKSFWDRLRVKTLLDSYMDGFIEYAMVLQDEYSLTDKHILGVIKMVDDNKLSKLSAMWKKVVPIQASFSNVPDGDYVGDLKEMKLADAKKSGRLQVEMTFEVADGEYEGKTMKRFDGVEDEQGMGYFKNVCEIIGLDLPDDLREWQSAMDEFVANNTTDLYDVTAKVNGQYTNIYINGISELVRAGAEGVEEQVVEEQVAEGEEVVEEMEIVEEQQITPPRRGAPVVVKPVARMNAQPVRQATVQQPVRRTVTPPPKTGGKKIVSLRK